MAVDIKKMAQRRKNNHSWPPPSSNSPEEAWKQKADPALPWKMEQKIREGMRQKVLSASELDVLPPVYQLKLGEKARYYKYLIIEVSDWLSEKGILPSHGGTVASPVYALVGVWAFVKGGRKEFGWAFFTAGASVESLKAALTRRADEKLVTWRNVFTEIWYLRSLTPDLPWDYSGNAKMVSSVSATQRVELNSENFSPPKKKKKARTPKWSV
jgi:hypothetical protein